MKRQKENGQLMNCKWEKAILITMNIFDKTPLLTLKQRNLLKQNASAIFSLGDYMSLDDIVTKLKVEVHIEPGKPTRSVDDYYDKAKEYWRNEYEKLLEMHRMNPENEYIRQEWQKAEIKMGRLNVECKAHSAMSLLGLYDSQQNIIQLFPEAMADADASKMDEYLVSTFAHEVMHAYFNRPGHEKFPYAMFVEEPLAEFGMLLYLWRTHSAYYDWAHENVRSKKCCYRYGAAIMDQYIDGERSYGKYLEEYKVPVGEYDLLSNGRISMPMESDSVSVNSQGGGGKWKPVFSIPPTYFWDETTKTLGLNGEWSVDTLNLLNHHSYIRIHLYFHGDDIQHFYLGKDFVSDDFFFRHFERHIPSVPVSVSPQNKGLTSVKGILVPKRDNSPVLRSCGKDYYKLRKNNKYCIIDTQYNSITPFKYDDIRHFDENGLCKVQIGDVYGLVNKQGAEQVPVNYEHITSKGRLYEVKQNGEVFTIDEFGNKQ